MAEQLAISYCVVNQVVVSVDNVQAAEVPAAEEQGLQGGSDLTKKEARFGCYWVAVNISLLFMLTKSFACGIPCPMRAQASRCGNIFAFATLNIASCVEVPASLVSVSTLSHRNECKPI
jgi:hypothetical protein